MHQIVWPIPTTYQTPNPINPLVKILNGLPLSPITILLAQLWRLHKNTIWFIDIAALGPHSPFIHPVFYIIFSSIPFWTACHWAHFRFFTLLLSHSLNGLHPPFAHTSGERRWCEPSRQTQTKNRNPMKIHPMDASKHTCADKYTIRRKKTFENTLHFILAPHRRVAKKKIVQHTAQDECVLCWVQFSWWCHNRTHVLHTLNGFSLMFLQIATTIATPNSLRIRCDWGENPSLPHEHHIKYWS